MAQFFLGPFKGPGKVTVFGETVPGVSRPQKSMF